MHEEKIRPASATIRRAFRRNCYPRGCARRGESGPVPGDSPSRRADTAAQRRRQRWRLGPSRGHDRYRLAIGQPAICQRSVFACADNPLLDCSMLYPDLIHVRERSPADGQELFAAESQFECAIRASCARLAPDRYSYYGKNMPKRRDTETTKVSIAITPDDLEIFRARAKRLHRGNLSAAISDAAAKLRREEAAHRLLARLGAPELSEERAAEIDRELRGELPRKRRDAAR